MRGTVIKTPKLSSDQRAYLDNLLEEQRASDRKVAKGPIIRLPKRKKL